MKPKVDIYTSPTCPHCKRAKDYLSEKGIPYEDHDVKNNKEALEEMKKVSGGATRVPVIAVCHDVVVGFDPDRVEQALSCMQQSSEVSAT